MLCSIRLPEDLATEINARAAAEGVKPSTWIRNCITSAIRQKNELNADMLQTPLLMLLKRDKSVRAIIKEIAREKLPEEEQLRKKCEDLTTSMSGIMEQMDKTKEELNGLLLTQRHFDDKAKRLAGEIGALKQMSHGTENNAVTKEMIERSVANLAKVNAERIKVSKEIFLLENQLRDDEKLILDMKEENIQAMKKLELISGSPADPQSRDEL